MLRSWKRSSVVAACRSDSISFFPHQAPDTPVRLEEDVRTYGTFCLPGADEHRDEADGCETNNTMMEFSVTRMPTTSATQKPATHRYCIGIKQITAAGGGNVVLQHSSGLTHTHIHTHTHSHTMHYTSGFYNL